MNKTKNINLTCGNNKLLNINKNIKIGGNAIHVIAGPCAVESEEQLFKTADYCRDYGATMLRGGAYKPRTKPNSFQGLGDVGLELLVAAKKAFNMPIVTELMDIRKLDYYLELGIDIIQVGSRNMQNFTLLKELSQVKVPIILKRGLAATIEEWLGAIEYLTSGGNEQIILCERGIRSFETSYRNTLDISAIPFLKQRCNFPIIVDPSHAAGNPSIIPALAKAAIAAGADGIMLETHYKPSEALSDKEQALSKKELKKLMQEIVPVAKSVNRSISNNT